MNFEPAQHQLPELVDHQVWVVCVDGLCYVLGSFVCLEVGLPWAAAEVWWADVGV